jgi:hypothetical protein
VQELHEREVVDVAHQPGAHVSPRVADEQVLERRVERVDALDRCAGRRGSALDALAQRLPVDAGVEQQAQLVAVDGHVGDLRQLAQRPHRLDRAPDLDADQALAHLLAQHARRALRDQLAGQHEADLVAALGLVEVVRGDEQRGATLAEVVEEVPHPLPLASIDAGCRLVEKTRGDRAPARRARGAARAARQASRLTSLSSSSSTSANSRAMWSPASGW